jgi:dihydropteroate synthase
MARAEDVGPFEHRKWGIRDRVLSCGPKTLVMGILNVTPDSFSDGGRFLDQDEAVAQGVRMVEDGADILDVGGESTRPGSDEVEIDEEIQRVVPVIKRLQDEVLAPISIDTRKAEVARAAIAAGASIVNDVSAAREPGMFELARETGAGLVLMHMLGEPKTMQDDPVYTDVAAEVQDYLRSRIKAAHEAGIPHEQLCIDPGLGFGKTYEHNIELMKEMSLARMWTLGCPVLVGPSRKSFIGKALGDLPVEQRLEGTLAAVAVLIARGVHIVRVHDVKETVRVASVVDAITGRK